MRKALIAGISLYLIGCFATYRAYAGSSLVANSEGLEFWIDPSKIRRSAYPDGTQPLYLTFWAEVKNTKLNTRELALAVFDCQGSWVLLASVAYGKDGGLIQNKTFDDSAKAKIIGVSSLLKSVIPGSNAEAIEKFVCSQGK